MKKVLLVAILALSVAITANAQLKIGVKAGANFAGVNDSETNMTIGFTGGVLGQFKLSDKWAIQPEVLFNMQGAKYSGSIDQTWRLNYIAVPVMAQYNVFKGLSVELGPQFGFLITSKSKYSGSKHDMKDYTKSFELALGAGAAYEIADFPIGFFARYTFGLIEFDSSTSIGTNLRNYALQVGAFFKF